jgi:uncharacterized phiE125 gp8 family phage protein
MDKPRFSLVTGPVEEPIDLQEAKDHLRVDITADDALIGRQITAVRQVVEKMYDIALVNQTWDMYLNAFPGGHIEIPIWPLSSVTSVKYTDIDSVESTYSSANYIVDTVSRPGQIVLKTSASWPGDSLIEVNGVVVRFIAGYGATAATVPYPVKQAILLLLGDLYENREETLIVERATASAQQLGIVNLLTANYRSYHF